MNTTITNGILSVTVSDYGAELQSVHLRDTERLWQGDAAVWEERSPILFPFVGRVKNGAYTDRGVEYKTKGPHGFARRSRFTLVSAADDTLVYRLTSSPETKTEYPYDFILEVSYRIADNVLYQSFTVKNTDSCPIRYSFGAHPGFLVPPTDASEFDDWYLEFSDKAPLRQAMLDGMFMSDRVEPCPYAEGNIISLFHSMFDDDAFILAGLSDKRFVLKNKKTEESIAVDATGFDYLAFWQAAGSNAPFLCVEPWNGLPSDAKAPEDLAVKRDLRTLAPDASETCTVSYALN